MPLWPPAANMALMSLALIGVCVEVFNDQLRIASASSGVISTTFFTSAKALSFLTADHTVAAMGAAAMVSEVACPPISLNVALRLSMRDWIDWRSFKCRVCLASAAVAFSACASSLFCSSLKRPVWIPDSFKAAPNRLSLSRCWCWRSVS